MISVRCLVRRAGGRITSCDAALSPSGGACWLFTCCVAILCVLMLFSVSSIAIMARAWNIAVLLVPGSKDGVVGLSVIYGISDLATIFATY